MPKFVKTNVIVEVNRHGIETDRQVLFTDDEVVTRVQLNPSLVVEVTESHAAQVIRPQQKYQELSETLLAAIEGGEVSPGLAQEDDAPVTDPTPESEDAPIVEEDKGGTLSFGTKK